jgi:hypothetical protein
MNHKDVDQEAVFERLVKDTMICRFNENEAIQFVKQRSKKPFGREHYYRLKKKLLPELMTDERLVSHVQDGYVEKHFEVMDEADNAMFLLQRILTLSVYKEAPDVRSIASVAHEINELIKTKTFLNLGGPVIARIRQELEQYRAHGRVIQIESTAGKEEDTGNTEHGNGSESDTGHGNDESAKPILPSTSLVLQSDLNAESEAGSSDSGRLPAREEPSERVF